MTKKKVIISVLLVFLVSLVPSIYRTVKATRTAQNLILLAMLEPDEMTFNPYDKNGYFIDQDLAVWILKTFEYPYCSEFKDVKGLCGISLIAWVGRGLDMHGIEAQKRGYDLLDYFILRGEPINSLNFGMAPIHEAILYRNPRYLEVLLSANADPNTSIKRPGKVYDGFNAYQYLELLESRKKNDFSKIRVTLFK
jgi:hypothetical protein